ncbi:hypothetical protein P280DRAFT_523548 [Massarina eburnea CBS 473.64]|uniref:Secreted protein n=1 Tax=Massarina eburnea CBS 473.64 TaxID=1395130 RepID=A0A6A6RHV4_9PLEO|nr:hypothetical protein P280DRAFT_523548 [Massarina eburnea CBS 473.64]
MPSLPSLLLACSVVLHAHPRARVAAVFCSDRHGIIIRGTGLTLSSSKTPTAQRAAGASGRPPSIDLAHPSGRAGLSLPNALNINSSRLVRKAVVQAGFYANASAAAAAVVADLPPFLDAQHRSSTARKRPQ